MPLVTYERQGAVAIITLNRPEKLNAMNTPLLADLLATRFVDLTVAAEAAIFEITEVRLGQMYGWESGREFGLTRTACMELAFGVPLSGRRAFEVGLANDVAPNDQLMTIAMARAEHVARMPQRVIRYHRELLRMMVPPIPEDVQRVFTEYYAAAQSSADFTEGDRAFLEKCKTEFTA